MARAWKMIFDALEDSADLAWMPAHTALRAVNEEKLSNGQLLTHRDRQGNIIADLLAKKGAALNRVPAKHKRHVDLLDRVVNWACRQLAVNTWAANNHPTTIEGPDGPTTVTRRDSSGLPACKRPAKRKEYLWNFSRQQES